ncbi:MAG TPA: phosphoribosylformylglycinamidine synthase subunit PurL [Polyangiaceae bacterium]|nr:phosphoribosylformylglycinamidine synthase subunit PurL [Polyangiaceae bacterium]
MKSPSAPNARPEAFPGDVAITDSVVRSHHLTPDEYKSIEASLGRAPSYTELGVFSVMWSEHCSYKSSRIHLGRLPTKGPRVIQGPGENAGVVDIGDGYAAVFKMESHNHPSFIEPYQGAATGVGGILRDVFTMGARPVANLNSLRFGRPDHPRTATLLRGVVAGIGGYGNCVGVPTVGGELQFDPSYDGNILVNAFTCGVARTDRIFYGRAAGLGNPILYIGAKTGRDGIHGATMASDEFSAEGPSQRPTVQVGDPFMEKLLIEACLEIMSEDVLEGIQDMGAAGLTSSSVEMASRSGTGLDLNLDMVPRRARRLSPYEMLLSESQERMLLVAKKGCEERVIAICKKWDLDSAVIGHVTDTGRWVVRATPGYDPLDGASRAGEPVVVCDLPVSFLADAAPKYDRPRASDPTLAARLAYDPATIPAPGNLKAELLRMVGSPNLGSRRWVWRQYDHIVRGGTAVRPGSDAGVVRVPCQVGDRTVDKWLAFSSDCNGRYAELDAYQGGAMAVAEACRNLAVTGAEPIGVTDCLNFGSPERPEIMEQFSRAIDGMAAACRALAVPVVSGNVSLYNETDGRAIIPTPTIGAVGLIANESDIVTSSFKRAGDVVVVLGPAGKNLLGASEYVFAHTGKIQGPLPSLDLDMEKSLQLLALELARARLVSSMHDVSDGGLATALVECAVAVDRESAMIGAEIALPASASPVAALFSEEPSRVVASVAPANLADVKARAARAGVPLLELGKTAAADFVIRTNGSELVRASLTELREARERCLEPIVGK